MSELFQKLQKMLKQPATPEKRFIRHANEAEMINTAIANLSEIEMGRILAQFVENENKTITILRGRFNNDFATSEDSIYVSIPSNMDVDDPQITIRLAGAIRIAMQESDPMLRRVGVDRGESIYVQREEHKHEDKLFWQTGVVYELGTFAGREEFIDSFTLMGYGALLSAYEEDLNNG